MPARTHIWNAIAAFAAVVTLIVVFAPAASAKLFGSGDLRVCASGRCLPITSRPVLNEISVFYYGSASPVVAKSPNVRAPYVELQFRDGYVTGVASGSRFDRFLSFGVNVGHFAAGTWYAIPNRVAAELRRLASRLRPKALPRNVLDLSH